MSFQRILQGYVFGKFAFVSVVVTVCSGDLGASETSEDWGSWASRGTVGSHRDGCIDVGVTARPRCPWLSPQSSVWTDAVFALMSLLSRLVVL